MEDIYTSIKAYLYDRAVSPLFGAFAVAWIVWNFRLILVVFGDADVWTKLTWIDNFYSESITIHFVELNYSRSLVIGLLYPFCTALLYILVYPLIAFPLFIVSLKFQSWMNNAKNSFHEGILLSPKKSREILRQLSTAEEEHEKELQEKDNEIALMQELIDTLHSENAKKTNDNNSKPNNLTVPDSVSRAIKSKIDSLDHGDQFTLQDLLNLEEVKAASVPLELVDAGLHEILKASKYHSKIIAKEKPGEPTNYVVQFSKTDQLRASPEIKILKLFADTPKMRDASILSKSPFDPQVTELTLIDLVDKGLLQEEQSLDDKIYELTKKGQKELLLHG